MRLCGLASNTSGYDSKGRGMKLEEFRSLTPTESAVVLDNGKNHVAVSEHNELGGVCDCCKNWSVADAELVLVRDVLTGEIVWQRD